MASFVLINKNGKLTHGVIMDEETARKIASDTGKRIAEVAIKDPVEVEPSEYYRIIQIFNKHNIKVSNYKKRFRTVYVPLGDLPQA